MNAATVAAQCITPVGLCHRDSFTVHRAPDAFTTVAHFFVSAAMNFAKSARNHAARDRPAPAAALQRRAWPAPGGFLLQAVDHLGRCPPAPAGRNHEPPRSPSERAGLSHRGQIRQRAAALGAGDRQRLELAGLMCGIAEGRLSNIRSMLRPSGRAAPGPSRGREVDHVGAGHGLEEFAGEVDRGAIAAAGHVQLAGVGLRATRIRSGTPLMPIARPWPVYHQHVGTPTSVTGTKSFTWS